jgi:hypothetical protein
VVDVSAAGVPRLLGHLPVLGSRLRAVNTRALVRLRTDQLRPI